MKVLWAIPAYRWEVHARIIPQMMMIAKQTPEDWKIEFTSAHSPDVSALHNSFLEAALAGEYNILVIQGADSWALEPAKVWQMLRSMKVEGWDIVGAPIVCKGGNYNVQKHAGDTGYQPGSLRVPHEVDRIGSGFTAYNPKVFESCSMPPFLIQRTEKEHVGCDYAACDVARELGARIYCDPRVSVMHRSVVAYSGSHGETMQEPC